MTEVTWTQVLLVPQQVPRSAGDRFLVTCLLRGDVFGADTLLSEAGLEHGIAALSGPDAIERFPVAASLYAWIDRFGRDVTTAYPLPGNSLDETGPDEEVAAALLAALALGTDDQHDAAEQRLRTVLASTPRPPLDNVVRIQLSHRLLDAGRAKDARELADVVLARPPSTDPTAIAVATVARHLRIAALPFDEITSAERRTAFGFPPVPNTDDLVADGLSGLTSDVLDAHTVAASASGSRWRNADERLWALIGAWLQSELWGNHREAVAARQRLATYALTGSAVSRPQGWSWTVADAADIDLLRRGRDEQRLGRVVRWWWVGQPVEPLKTAVGIACSRQWASPVVDANLTLLAGAGDLVAPSKAPEVVERVLSLVGDPEAVGVGRITRVVRAASSLMAAAADDAQASALQTWRGWVGSSSTAYGLRPLARAIRFDRLPSPAVDQTLAWAEGLLDGRGPDGTIAIGEEVVVAIANTIPARKGDLVTAAWRRFEAAPTVGRAVVLARLAPREDLTELAVWVTETLDSGNQTNGAGTLNEAVSLLAHLAEEGPAIVALRAQLEAGNHDQVTLGHIAARPNIARQVITKSVQRELRQSDQKWEFFDEGGTWPPMAALVAAGAVDEPTTIAWLTERMSRNRSERWRAAKVLPAATEVVRSHMLVGLWATLAASTDVEVASVAAGLAPTLMEAGDEATRAVLVQVVESLGDREGVLAPLTATRTLKAMDRLPAAWHERFTDHPSALVREILA